MSDAPNSYRDPFWSGLAASTEEKLGLPSGLLVSVLTRGERSNANQVSSAGARTPFQIIPATRVAAAKKYGIDAYLSAENAAEVAGLILRDSLKRNKGDIGAAVGEYIGGTDRSNWGRQTRAYVDRVMQGVQQAPVADPTTDAPMPVDPGAGAPSTFSRVWGEIAKPSESAIGKVFEAYKAGKMAPDEAAQFEADVKAGKVMLPRGAAMQSKPQGAPELPAGVIAAMQAGKLSPQESQQLAQDIRAGMWTLPEGVQLASDGALQAGIPGQQSAQPSPDATKAPGLLDKAIGTGEAALSAITGATGGALGMVGGALGGAAGAIASGEFGTKAAADKIEQAAAEGAQALTYAPRTQSGQDQAAVLGEAMNSIGIPAAGAAMGLRMPAGAMGAAGQALKVPAAAVLDKAATAVPAAVREIPGRVAAAVRPGEPSPTPGTMGSVGAAGLDMATQRVAAAESLPVPIKLTKGQATRDPAQLTFEREAAKQAETGEPLRQRQTDQNGALTRNMEAMIDQTGAVAPNLIETGRAVVDAALVPAAARLKNAYRALYKQADKAGEMEQPVSAAPVVQFLADNASMNAPELAGGVLGLIQRELVRLGGAEVVDGVLAPREMTLGNMELLRRQIGNAIDAAPDNATNMRAGVQARQAIDALTEGVGGDLYKQARAARRRYAQLFEDNAIVADLMRTRRGTSDRQVALEDVFRRSILNGSRESLSMLRRTLQVAGGADGAQAWRELQGATLGWIRSQATKSAAPDAAGMPTFSAHGMNSAIRALDQAGKLEFMFGRKGAQQLRDLNDIASTVQTLPREAWVNTSNTAAVGAAIVDAILMGGGAPAPLMSAARYGIKQIKDAKLRRRINDALDNAQQRQAPNNKPGTPIQAPGSGAIH